MNLTVKKEVPYACIESILSISRTNRVSVTNSKTAHKVQLNRIMSYGLECMVCAQADVSHRMVNDEQTF